MMAWIRRHPVAAFLAWFFPVGWAIAFIPLIAKNTLGVEWGIEALPRPNLEGLKNILREMAAPQRNPSEFVDMSLLDEIEKEGFMQKLR